MLSSQLLEAVFRTVETLPPSSIQNVAVAMGCGLPFAEWRSRVMDSVALPQERVILSALLTAWEQEGESYSPTLLSIALQSALHTKSAMEQTRQVELVWTGPTSSMIFRRTDQALLQLIRAANHSLLLVTFAAYKIPLLLDALRQAIERGVRVRFVAESAESSGGKVAFDAATALHDLAEQIEFYVWPREKRERDVEGHFGSLHAKCALADEELLLVSSANMTDHALSLNIEMGTLVYGGRLPIQVCEHFDYLIHESILVRVR